MEGRGELSALDDLRHSLSTDATARIVGSGSRAGFLPGSDAPELSTQALQGVIAHDVDDQVVEVWAGTTLSDLDRELRNHGQCLPLATGLPDLLTQAYGTVGGLLSLNAPHALQAQCGGPRDWTLGMTILRTDGTLAKSGSKAVKSVAGYDAHKLFVGARGTLGVIASVVLRTYPVKALPAPTVQVFKERAGPCFVSRTMRTDFDRTCQEAQGLLAMDPASCTLWSEHEPAQTPHAWSFGPHGARTRPEQPEKFESRLRDVFDAERKLAAGWKA